MTCSQLHDVVWFLMLSYESVCDFVVINPTRTVFNGFPQLTERESPA